MATVCVLAGCAAQQQQGTTMGPQDQASLEAYVRETFDHMGKGDFAFLKQSMCHEAVVFDIDENGAPITKRGEAEVGAMIDHYQQMFASSGAVPTTTLNRLDCRVDGASFCTGEFDQTVKMGDQVMGPMKFRFTIIAHQHAGKWIWTHWHASLRENPGTPAPPSPPAPEAPAPAAAAPAAPPPAPPAPPPAPEKKKGK
ncbi:MAG TPA: nuclear transport factor 2 family protein, partial [Polyangiales bacterium]|nr:nuclear transport factor 2 family protein [Polyangiales bacterium]